jgi:VWFA-related protein
VLGALEKSLALLRPEDRMAIVAFFSGRVDVLSGWTGDRKALAAALQAARKRPALGHDVVATRRSQQYEAELVSQALALSDPDGGAGDDLSGARGLEIGAPGGTASTGDPRLDGRLSKLARAAVATMYAMTPPSGRRTLIVLSGGWPVPHLHISLALAANRLGYTVYPVDVQGIDTALIVNDASLDHSTPDSFITAPWKRVSQDGMELLARMTGGRAILNSARLTALDRVMEDTNSYYWLGFAPSWKGDDRHHPISVKARRKDLKVRSRRGFSDLSRATEATMTAQGILLVGGDERTKKLTIETDPLGRKGKVVEVGVTVAIPLADLTPVEQDGKWKVEATLAAAALDKGGLFSDLTEIPLHLTLPRKPAPDAVARYHTRMKLSRVEQRLVVTVRDPLGGAAVWGETEIKP